MAKYVVKYHFDRDHHVRYVLEADSMSDARSRVTEFIRGDNDFRVVEFRSEDSLYVIPLAAIRFIQVIEAEKELAHPRWPLD